MRQGLASRLKRQLVGRFYVIKLISLSLATVCLMSSPARPDCVMQSGRPQVSAFIGNDPSALAQMYTWLDGHLDAVQLHGGTANWTDWESSLDWQANLFKDIPTDIKWSVPLIPQGASLKEAAAGNYDDRYRSLAQQFARHYGTARVINIRLGWEFNATGWNPWSAVGQPANYIAAWRRFVTIFRETAPNFRFEWTPNIGNVGMDPSLAYPGDKYVDLIGMDFYYDTRWDPADPQAAWDYFVKEPFGLQWHQEFAAAHSKPTAYSEWGVNSDHAAQFITHAADWFRTHPVVYQNYWNSNSAFAGLLTNGQYPSVATQYQQEFAKLYSKQCLREMP